MHRGPDHDGAYVLRTLDACWDKTQQHWHDDVARHFDVRYWTPLAKESREYLDALRKIIEILYVVERETEY